MQNTVDSSSSSSKYKTEKTHHQSNPHWQQDGKGYQTLTNKDSNSHAETFSQHCGEVSQPHDVKKDLSSTLKDRISAESSLHKAEKISNSNHTTVNEGTPIITNTCPELPAVPSNPYLPGKIHGKTLYMMIDTGCTNSILSKTMFDRLPASMRGQLRPSQSGATMADGSRTKIYGQITLSTKLRTIKREINFHVARTHHDAILGMDFFNQGCKIDLGRALFEIDGKQLACTDKYGNLLSKSTSAQIYRNTPRFRMLGDLQTH